MARKQKAVAKSRGKLNSIPSPLAPVLASGGDPASLRWPLGLARGVQRDWPRNYSRLSCSLCLLLARLGPRASALAAAARRAPPSRSKDLCHDPYRTGGGRPSVGWTISICPEEASTAASLRDSCWQRTSGYNRADSLAPRARGNQITTTVQKGLGRRFRGIR